MTALLLLALALDVAWQGVRAIAWHGWAAAELVAALGVLAVVAGALSDTAKAYSTEKRVNELAGRHSSHVQVSATGWSVTANAGAGQISGTLTIPANGMTAVGAEYEIYVEGEGKWGGTGQRHNLSLWIQLGAQQLALSIVAGDPTFNFDDVIAFWMRGTVAVEKVTGTTATIRAFTSGHIWHDVGGNRNDAGKIIGRCGAPQDIPAGPAYPMTLNAWWDATGGTMHIAGHRARLTRRGP